MTLAGDGQAGVSVTTSYDELVTGGGAFRPHWRGLMEIWSQLDPEQLAERASRVAAQIAATDQMLVPQNRADGSGRSLDLMPLIIPEQEWQIIASGLVQRAQLLDRVLGDLYGAQRLLAEHRLPAYLVLGNPAFLRPLRAVKPAAGAPQLYFYAADLVRVANGEWRVYSDGTQAPAGVGYALYNRNVLARALPEIFRAVPVTPLQSFLELWRASLRTLAARIDEQPLVVLFTPGPYNDAYFEHVYLARELGITLVQSADLTVRDGHVYLKTLGGLARIDVIYRRVDGNYCDSLELREDSALGVAGLVEVARLGNVALLNMPGAAAIETPAFAPFLPELARTLLGEELKLPAVTTWWCGQEAARAEVLARLDDFALQLAYERDPVPIDPVLLDKQERARFLEQLVREPERFVAREKMPPSVAPCFGIEEAGGGRAVLKPRPVVMRVTAVWHDGKWFAMPGGVARVVGEPTIYNNSVLRHGGVAKDVWVLGEEFGAGAFPIVTTVLAPPARTEGEDLRSRTADDLFWLGRQVERLEAGVRLFLAALQRLTSGAMTPRNVAELQRLVEALKRSGWISFNLAAVPVDSIIFFEGLAEAATEGVAMRSSIDAIHRLMHSARDQLSVAMWETLNRLTNVTAGHFGQRRVGAGETIERLEGMVAGLAAFGGLVAEDMTRDAGWRFLDFGRRIERGIATCTAVGGVIAGPPGQVEAGLRLALEVCNATSAYVLRFPLETQFVHVLEFVLKDRSNPRALLYQLDRIEHHLWAQAKASRRAAVPTIVADLIATIERTTLAAPDGEGAAPMLEELGALLADVGNGLMALSDQVTRIYFTHTAPSHMMDFASRQIAAQADD
ncbi:MAG TPA: circularly permuted type 2 ATP-grasp protein [Stellaceae bacterium]|jgi:uncharacterized circularly permuted ATP-grasp superfamily protein/uncharacterized alpha-E superfamily protein|nr:circularly permuted type 2 ATP-grasp protein [Stellaceae bacterium]